MSISVIIPTHYRDDLLVRALRSVLAQSLSPCEVVIVDDTSRREVQNIVKEVGRENSIKVRYIERKNYKEESSPASINLAVEKACGSHIAFLDDDDYWDMNYLESAYGLMEKTRADFVVAATWNYFKKGKKVTGKMMPDKFSLQECYTRNLGFACSNVLLKKETFCQAGGFDVSLIVNADKDMFLKLLEGGHKYAVLKERLIHVAKYVPGTSRGKSKKMFLSNVRFYRKHQRKMSMKTHFKFWFRLVRLAYNAYLPFHPL